MPSGGLSVAFHKLAASAVSTRIGPKNLTPHSPHCFWSPTVGTVLEWLCQALIVRRAPRRGSFLTLQWLMGQWRPFNPQVGWRQSGPLGPAQTQNLRLLTIFSGSRDSVFLFSLSAKLS